MKFTDEYILDYLDGSLSTIEKQRFEAELATNMPLTNKVDALMSIHKSLMKNELLSPSASFNQKVMASIKTINLKEARFFNRSRSFVLIVVMIVLATTLYYLGANFYPTLGGAIADKITLRNITISLQPAQELLSSTLLFKVVLYVNGLVCLLLLDRAFLKPYFAHRKNRYSM